MASEFVDKISDNPPPSESSGEDTDESQDIVIEFHVFYHEVELGEKSDYKKQNEGIGECKSEAFENITLARGSFLICVSLHIPRRFLFD